MSGRAAPPRPLSRDERDAAIARKMFIGGLFLLPWLWAGGLVIGVGGLLSMVPDRRRRRDEPESEEEPTLEEVSV